MIQNSKNTMVENRIIKGRVGRKKKRKVKTRKSRTKLCRGRKVLRKRSALRSWKGFTYPKINDV